MFVVPPVRSLIVPPPFSLLFLEFSFTLSRTVGRCSVPVFVAGVLKFKRPVAKKQLFPPNKLKQNKTTVRTLLATMTLSLLLMTAIVNMHALPIGRIESNQVTIPFVWL